MRHLDTLDAELRLMAAQRVKWNILATGKGKIDT
jgi:hypothetical protein